MVRVHWFWTCWPSRKESWLRGNIRRTGRTDVCRFAVAETVRHLRATGYSWTTNLFGRFTEIVTPFAIGWLADRIGIPWAVGVMAFGPVIGGLIVPRYAPETRGKTLEEISNELDGEAALQPATAAEKVRASR